MWERERSRRGVRFVVQEINQTQAGGFEADGRLHWKFPGFQ